MKTGKYRTFETTKPRILVLLYEFSVLRAVVFNVMSSHVLTDQSESFSIYTYLHNIYKASHLKATPAEWRYTNARHHNKCPTLL